MSDSQQKNWEVENVVGLDSTLDDIEDLPGFGVFPTGSYLCTLPKSFEVKDINDHPAFAMELQLDQILELNAEDLAPAEQMDSGEEEKPPKIGDVCTLSWMRDNKVGIDAFKKAVKPIANYLGLSRAPLSQLQTQMRGLKVLVVLKRTYNEEKDRHYVKVRRIAVP